MNDVISRQALRDAMYHEAFETDTKMQRWNSGCWIRYKLFENVIDNLPSVQKRGEWELIDGAEPRRYGCSVCKWLSWHETNYCPHCGADMRPDNAPLADDDSIYR